MSVSFRRRSRQPAPQPSPVVRDALNANRAGTNSRCSWMAQPPKANGVAHPLASGCQCRAAVASCLFSRVLDPMSRGSGPAPWRASAAKDPRKPAAPAVTSSRNSPLFLLPTPPRRGQSPPPRSARPRRQALPGRARTGCGGRDGMLPTGGSSGRCRCSRLRLTGAVGGAGRGGRRVAAGLYAPPPRSYRGYRRRHRWCVGAARARPVTATARPRHGGRCSARRVIAVRSS